MKKAHFSPRTLQTVAKSTT